MNNLPAPIVKLDNDKEWKGANPFLKMLKYVRRSGFLSDFVLRVGDPDETVKNFRAHKIILAMSSPVFESMFTSQCIESTEGMVVIPDIQPGAFEKILDYMYTVQIELKSFDEVKQVLYAAEKYFLVRLTQRCERYLLKNINGENIFDFFELAFLFNLNKLECCVRQGSQILEKKQFLNASLNFIKFLLDQHPVNIPEVELIKRLEQWFDHHIKGLDSKKIRLAYVELVSNEIKSRVCFRNLSIEEFSNNFLNCNFLTLEEINLLFKAISEKKNKFPPNFTNRFRKFGMPRPYTRFKIRISDWTIGKSVFTTVVNSSKLNFYFSTDTDIYLVGVLFLLENPPKGSSRNAKYVERLEIRLKCPSQTHTTSYANMVKYGQSIEVYFPSNIPLTNKQIYEIEVVTPKEKPLNCVNFIQSFNWNKVSHCGVQFTLYQNLNEISIPRPPLTPISGLIFYKTKNEIYI